MPGIRLHLADDVAPVWRATADATGMADAPIPFWAFAWAGGLALARYLVEHPEEVRDQRILDLATGSGLCAIVALRAGAREAVGVDIDPFAEVAAARNAKANDVRMGFVLDDLLDGEPPDADVVLAGDTWYEGPFAARVLPFLQRAAARGSRVLVGDPNRRYRPKTGLDPLATYAVRTTTRLEDRDVVTARVSTVERPTG